jgi:iron complex transport system substrate-binding protein
MKIKTTYSVLWAEFFLCCVSLCRNKGGTSLNRTKQVTGTLLVLGTLILSGCGGQTAQSQGGAGNTSAKSATKAAFPLTLTDDSSHKVTIPKQPHHIVSTTEGTDEILSALVPKSDIVMVTQFAAQPDFSNITSFVKGIPAIGDANAEQIIAASPDLVLLASYTKPGVVTQIEQAGIPAYEFADFNSISDIEKNIKIVGQLVGEELKANNVVQSMNVKLGAIADAVKGQQKFSVLDYSSTGFAAGSATTVNDTITAAGATNAGSALQGWQKITDEEVVKLNPDVIIDASNDKRFTEKIMRDPALQTVAAVKNNRVYELNGADLTSVSQYAVNGVSDLAHVLYPTLNLPQ